MANYNEVKKEETFKATIFRDFFSSSKYAYEPNIDNIDFIVAETSDLKKSATLKGNMGTRGSTPRHYLWAESKKGIAEIYQMLTQLVLTIKKTYEKSEHLPPLFIACFDTEKIAFVPFHDILPIFNDSDVNWNTTPSNHTSSDFKKTQKKVEKLSRKNIVIFYFGTDKKEIVDFINNNLVSGNVTSKFQINKNNFVIIYSKWLEKVKKSIGIDWAAVKKAGIIDGDFFLADILSRDNETLKDKLFVILQNNQYRFDKKFDDAGFSLYKEVGFNDNQKAHKEFWDKYERPPLTEYWDYIIKRRDLLVPQDIRERKGSFFTPKQWVELSQKYIADALGESWQDEYYIWDCAAGTGNLLAGLTNKYNIWASTLDKADVDVMKDRIKHGANILESNVFQFDFLNDGFSKLPNSLQKIIKNESTRKKLLIYINPPYAESASSHGIKGKKAVEQSNIHDKYASILSHAQKELSAQFFARIYNEIPDCKIGEFSKLKILQSPRFSNFRDFFKAKLLKCFVVHANTFDNVKGSFPIGFKIWDTEIKKLFKFVDADIFADDGTKIGKKRFWSFDNHKLINQWAATFKESFQAKHSIATLVGVANDFQQQNVVFIDQPYKKVIASNHNFQVTAGNLLESSVYYAVRKCIPRNWLNDRDQFLFPNENWELDIEFKNDCFTYTVFNTTIQSKLGTNYWIPFTEDEINAKSNFDSRFLTKFIKGKTDIINGDSVLFEELEKKPKALKFSSEAKDVFKAGKKLWQYYHKQPSANVNASLYDIREYFQRRDEKTGKMNNKSEDDTYNNLISDLRSALKALAEKIQPKIYEHGFLKK